MSDEPTQKVDDSPQADEPQGQGSPSAEFVTSIPDRLTDQQIKVIRVVIDELAISGNPVAQAASIALKDKTLLQQRAIIANVFSQVWAVVMVIHMAMNSKQTVGDLRRALREVRAGRALPIEKMYEAKSEQQ